MIRGLVLSIAVGCGAPDSPPPLLLPGDPLPVVIANYDYSNFVVDKGELRAISAESRVDIIFVIGSSGLSALKVKLKGKSIDLTGRAKGLAGYPTRIQVSSYETNGSEGMGTVISLPFERADQGCFTRNFSIEKGRLTEVSDSPTSPVRCVR